MRPIHLSLIITMLVPARAATAQKFMGLGAAVVIPTGDFGRIDNTGYGVTATWQSIPPLASAGFRVDASYAALSRKATIQDITERIASVSAGTVIRFPRISVSYGYAIAAAGVYNHFTSPRPIGSTSATDLGVSIGAGWRFDLAGRKVFTEVRYNRISGGGPRFVPVTFGLAF